MPRKGRLRTNPARLPCRCVGAVRADPNGITSGVCSRTACYARADTRRSEPRGKVYAAAGQVASVGVAFGNSA